MYIRNKDKYNMFEFDMIDISDKDDMYKFKYLFKEQLNNNNYCLRIDLLGLLFETDVIQIDDTEEVLRFVKSSFKEYIGIDIDNYSIQDIIIIYDIFILNIKHIFKHYIEYNKRLYLNYVKNTNNPIIMYNFLKDFNFEKFILFIITFYNKYNKDLNSILPNLNIINIDKFKEYIMLMYDKGYFIIIKTDLLKFENF